MNATPKTRIKRFTPLQRFFHLLLMLTFLIQGATGLSRMYMETPWGRSLGNIFGGYESARTVHVVIGIVMIGGFLVHVFYLLIKIRWRQIARSLTGPDSLLPQPRDIRHFFQHMAWFVGMRPAPEFDRWGYWEKFDYWAVFWGMVIIGGTGLILAFPLTSTRVMPGWGLNIAFWVHRIEAMLAMAHVFIIHFFIGHLRRHHFPLDRAMFEGSADLALARHERPAWIARLAKAGRLEGSLVAEVGLGLRISYLLLGYAAILAGLFLLIGALVNASRITW